MRIYIPLYQIYFLGTWVIGFLSCYIYWYSDSERMAQTGLLIVSNISRAPYFLPAASQHVKKTLYISLNPKLENVNYSNKFLSGIYTKATSLRSNLEVRVLLRQKAAAKLSTMFPIDLVLTDNVPSDVEKETFITSHIGNLQGGYKELSMDNIEVPSESAQQDNAVKKYEYVVLGGTFDRLHNGHKILLSEAIIRTTRHLTVGVTDTNMIQSKKLWELIEPVSVRISKLKEFLVDINPDIEYNVVAIDDMYGPTKDDPRLQLLVVSEETKRGGDKVNEKRKENGLPPMDVYSIELAGDIQLNEEEEEKISSSNTRMRLLGSLLRPPQENDKIPPEPYVIGLSGGIAAGKTKITERLSKMGAGIVNCDLLAHELYQPGLPLNATIAETFGPDVIMDNGEVDRKKLGQIVFSDKHELEKLNSVMWPAMLEEAQRRIQALGRAGHTVVVIEAAVMLQAGWWKYCHQLWTVIVPPEEAIKRLMSRNNITEQQARDRVTSQPNNLEQIAHANVVFSPFWKPDFTQSQVEKAWAHLQEYLAKRQNVVRQSVL